MFLGSGVLIAAFQGAPQLRELALQILEDPDRALERTPCHRYPTKP